MEADIVINGIKLTEAQSMAVRVAVAGQMMKMASIEALGTDEHGLFMSKAYWQRLGEVQEAIFVRLTRGGT